MLRLPPEIRIQIYALVMGGEVILFQQTRKKLKINRLWPLAPLIQPGKKAIKIKMSEFKLAQAYQEEAGDEELSDEIEGYLFP